MTKQYLSACAVLCLVAGILSTAPARGGEKKSDRSMVYELRTYTTLEGRLPALHKRFRDHTLQIFKKHGMTNVIYTTPVDGKNTLVYLIAHKSRAAADKSWKAFSDDPEWKKARAASVADGKILISVKRRYLTPTDYSPLKSGGLGSVVKKKGMVYELRTYTTNPNQLPNLHARFRDHTMRLFSKHGMTNVIYTTPLDEKTASNTLVYIVAHKSRKAANESWKAFRTDPEWQTAYKASIRDGRIVAKVQKQFLVPTEYSPVK